MTVTLANVFLKKNSLGNAFRSVRIPIQFFDKEFFSNLDNS